MLVDAARASEIAARLASQYNVTADPRVTIPLLDGALVRLRLPADRSLEPLLAALSADPDVELAQPNYDYSVSKATASPQERAAICRRDDQARRGASPGARQWCAGRRYRHGDRGAHPELAGAIAGMFDAVGEGPPAPEPHGTQIAGILAAHAELNGIAPEAKLLERARLPQRQEQLRRSPPRSS